MVSPKHESRVNLRGDYHPKGFEHSQRKDNERESDKDSSRSHCGRDSYRHSDRYSSRSSYGYSRHGRDGKYSRDKYDSSLPRSKDKETDSLALEHEKFRDKNASPDTAGAGGKHNPTISKETEHDRHDRNFRDEKRDYHLSFGDKKSDCTSHYVESKGYKNQESQAKKPKLFRSGWDADEAVANEKQKQVSEVDDKAANSEVTNDLNAAKVAALRAAELVNKNLVGVGFMSTEQKKKLLWGNKKATTSQVQSGNHWDTSSFDDRERQEKFKKLMSLRLVWRIVGSEGRWGCRVQARRRWSPTSRLGFGEAVHRWSTAKRRSHCWPGSLTFTMFSHIFFYFFARIAILIMFKPCIVESGYQIFVCMFQVFLDECSSVATKLL